MNNQPQGQATTTFPGYKQVAAVLRGACHNSQRPRCNFFAVCAEGDLQTKWLGLCAQLRKIV